MGPKPYLASVRLWAPKNSGPPRDAGVLRMKRKISQDVILNHHGTFPPQPNFLPGIKRPSFPPSPHRALKKRLHLCRLSPRVPVGARHILRPVRIRGVPPPLVPRVGRLGRSAI
ncbi:hypothetical protein TNCV_3554381 [Trichonephila clavipes]|nr:hypothetical protein TNCV_3554381 [Trichonephila clavipes]